MAFSKVSFANMSKEEWHQQRAKTIGGSDAGTVIGANKYKSKYALWAEKTGRVVPEDISDKEAVRLGHDLEEYVAQRFTEATGKALRKDNFFRYNTQYPFAHVEVDRQVLKENSIFEAKTTSSYEILKQCRNGDYPLQWYAQVLHGMAITGATKGYLAVLCFGNGFFYFEIERKQEEIDALMEEERKFWELVTSDTAPEIDGTESTAETIKSLYPNSKEGKEIVLFGRENLLADYQTTKESIALMEERLTEITNLIKAEMQDSEKASCGNFKISYKTQERKSFQASAFAKDNPNLNLTKYYKVSTSRPLIIKEKQ